MKQRILYIVLFIESVLLLIALIIGLFTYNIKAKRTEIFREKSPSGGYSLTISRIGEPDWPFGADHLRVALFTNDQNEDYKIAFQTDVYSDGTRAGHKVEWLEDGVKVILMGEEQSDAVYILPFKKNTP